MILFGIILFKCIKRFPILLVFFFCSSSLTIEGLTEVETIETTVDTETEEFVSNQIIFRSAFLKATTVNNFNPNIDAQFEGTSTQQTKKEYLLNCSLRYCG